MIDSAFSDDSRAPRLSVRLLQEQQFSSYSLALSERLQLERQ